MQADFEVLDTIIDAMAEELRSIREEADRTQDLIKKFSVQYTLLKKELGDCRKKAVPAKHGRWVYDANGMDWGLPAWICSECGFRNDMIPAHVKGKTGTAAVKDPMAWAGSRYCANCGARMDGIQ